MDESKPHILIFGAGMTGRGHIAQLAYESGWRITFVDKSVQLIDAISHSGRYIVRMISESPRDVVISGYQAFHIGDRTNVARALAESDMVVTAVLPNNLSGVAPVIAEGLRLRLASKENRPLNVIAAENMSEGSSTLWMLTSKHLSFKEQQQYGRAFGFPNSMIARVVPRSLDPLFILAEDYNEWTVDLLARVGEPPHLSGLEWVSDQEARLKRKLYIHNAGHAICAYLGALKGYGFIHEAMQDKWIASSVKVAITESGQAVERAYGFDSSSITAYAGNLLDRLSMSTLPDKISRVTREPIRKLGVKDRLLGPLALCEQYGLPREGLCLGIAAVLAVIPEDEEGLRLSAFVKGKGPIAALSEVSGYVPDAKSAQAIEGYYRSLTSHNFPIINLSKSSENRKSENCISSEPIWDILGFGIVAVDDILIVESYPSPDSKVPVLEKSRQGGGLTGTAMVAASRLGAKCAYGGVVGESELSSWTLSELKKEGIDCSPVLIIPNSQPYHAIIIVDRTHHTRTIFFSGDGVMPRPAETIDESLISKARVIFIDQLGIDSMLHASLIAKRLGIPTVADIERSDHPKTNELIAQIEHLILSTSFAGKLTGSEDPVMQVQTLHKGTGRACTAVTAGVRGCWYISREQPNEVQHQPAFKVQAVDTTGCGDVFHGAYAAGIAWGWSISRCIEFASATAAIKATKPGGRAGIPDKATVEKFLSARNGHNTWKIL